LILGKKKQIPNLKGYLSSLVFAQNEYWTSNNKCTSIKRAFVRAYML
jgi:hypothetical protein